MADSPHDNVHSWIQAHESDLIDLIQRLVRIPSVTGQEYKVQREVERVLSEMGLQPRFVYPDVEALRFNEDFFETTSFARFGYEKRPNVVTTLNGVGGGRSLCLSGHIDVVSPEPLNRWTRNPWNPVVENGKIYGRGAGDMKAGVAAMLVAVRAIQESGFRLRGDVQIETTIEEEDGGVGGVLYLRTVRPKTDAALIPEPSSLTIGVASAGVMYFRVTVRGVPAHAATAFRGINAINLMVPVIKALTRLHQEREKRIRYKYVDSDPRLEGHATTINMGKIRAGDWPSTVPAVCSLECRVGWPPGETREEVRAEIEAAIRSATEDHEWLGQHPPEIEWFGWNAKPHEQDISHPFVKTVSRVVSKVTGREAVYGGGAAGLDTRHFVHNGIPAVVVGPTAERIHSYDECVDIASVIKTTEVIASVLLDWCGYED
ncbi:MAG: ArgE/DapE family deacylase [Candidatus Thorarchaeota archaeon]